jgi:hypothetical protein
MSMAIGGRVDRAMQRRQGRTASCINQRQILLREGGGAHGLSLYRCKRWDPWPFEGTHIELSDTMNHDLGAWADAWT